MNSELKLQMDDLRNRIVICQQQKEEEESFKSTTCEFIAIENNF